MREAWTTGPWDGHKAFTVKGICVIRPPLLMACSIITHSLSRLSTAAKKQGMQPYTCLQQCLAHPCQQIAATCRAGKTNSDQACKQGNYASSQLKH